jgi:hypothetical protein
MSEFVYVKPLEGLRIREDSGSQLIPPAGMRVRLTRHITRRINEGELVECEQPAEVEAPADSATPAASEQPTEGEPTESEQPLESETSAETETPAESATTDEGN